MNMVYDAIHGFIPCDPLEADWIKSSCFIRLQTINQLGAAYRIFPGARHSRFEHSLGVMHLATILFDHVMSKTPFIEGSRRPIYRQALRLAALAHDLGHLPFSHTAEKLVLQGDCHEAWTLKLIDAEIGSGRLAAFVELGKKSGIDAVELMKKIAVGEEIYHRYVDQKPYSDDEKIMSEILTGDFFGADRMDYLLRDAKHSGLSYGVYDHQQLIMSMLVSHDPRSGKKVLMMDEKGLQACESMLVARYFMYRRLYMNPKVLVVAHPLSRIVKSVMDKMQGLASCENYLAVSDIEVLYYIRSKAWQSNEDQLWVEMFEKNARDYEGMMVTDHQLKVLQEGVLKNACIVVPKSQKRSFFNSDSLVKTVHGIYPFKILSKLVIPHTSENFVLFESPLMANVLSELHEAGIS